MPDTPLTKEEILDAAEQVFRRFGPEKASVVDVARLLGLKSHGTIYRHYPSKVALQEAVAKRFLEDSRLKLSQILCEPLSASELLRSWFKNYMHIKRDKATEDPEMYAIYVMLLGKMGNVISEHKENLASQLEKILTLGIKSGEFKVDDPKATANHLLLATTYFHHPAHTKSWNSIDIDSSLDGVINLILYGITTDPQRQL